MKGMILAVLFISNIAFGPQLECFEKVVIWGHKLHSHTHSYIHNAFYKGFKHLGYETYWFDNQEDVHDFDFAKSLFITEGQVDEKIPLREDCQYILHNCSDVKYQLLKPESYISLQVFSDAVLSEPDLIQVEPCIYYDLVGRLVYMPWATDLLPHEISAIQANLAHQQIEKTVYWVGTIGEGLFGNLAQVNPFKKACQENGINFTQVTQISDEKGQELIRKSYMAPTIVGEWQAKVGYIPCRIFKNISYGKMGVTNSARVHELFEGKLVYNPDTYQLFYDAKKRMETLSTNELYDLVELVKTKHTYLNRIETLLNFLELTYLLHAED